MTIDPRTTLVLIRAPSGVWEDKTGEIANLDARGSQVGVRFARTNKIYRYGANRIRVLDDPVAIPVPDGARLRVRGALWRKKDVSTLEVREFGHPPNAWRRISYRTGEKERHESHPADEVQIVPDASRDGLAKEVMGYWRTIVASRTRPDRPSQQEDPIVDAYRSLRHIDPHSALARYLNREAPQRRSAPEWLVFPFACNLSQREAVRQSLGHSPSVIEGPPGTGKTETILNLIANILTADLGSVGVVSFSNRAVENVGEKLEARGFGHIVAELGNNEKLQAFMDAQDARRAHISEFLDSAPTQPPPPSQLADVSRRLTGALEAQRRQAELRDRIDGYALEQRHFQTHLQKHMAPDLGDLPLLRRSSERMIEFLAETQIDQEAGRPGLLRRVRRYFRYGSSRGLDPADSEVVLALQNAFYERRIAELEQQLAEVERSLAAQDMDGLTRTHQELSERALAAAVASRHDETQPPAPYDRLPHDEGGFKAFCRDYPVILSTCHSLRRRLPDGYLLDYLIIDEASQVDLLTASLAMASCRNLIVVGDRRQLPHIPGDIPDDAAAPGYRLQADRAADSLGSVAGTIDTVYKLQGRQSRMVILTTVLSETYAGQRGLRFVDDPRLVNVAVSRATDHFVLVTDHQKLPSSRHLQDLVGYIEYRYPDQQPGASQVVSVFDLLYREYAEALRPLAERLPRGVGSPAERIIEVVLADILAEPNRGHLRVERQILLRNLVLAPATLSEDQRTFIRHRSSVDFVIYNRVTRRPVLAIEVDGFRFHEDRPEQLRRDALKDSILNEVGIPLLRLATTGSDEDRQIRAALADAETR